MSIAVYLEEPLAVRLEKRAAALQISLEDLVHRFLDTQLQNEPENVEQKQHYEPLESLMPELADDVWDEIEWVDEEEWDEEWDEEPWTIEDAKAAQEKFMLELEQEMAEMEGEIRREYGTGIDLVRNTAGMIDPGLSKEEMIYLIESPELSQQSLWLDRHLELV
ncbi:MAG: hypothetical protein AAF639_02065 [Chloroflexota bacterium]